MDLLKDYKAAVMYGGYSESILCSCGHFQTLSRWEDKVCSNCGNRNILDIGHHTSTKRKAIDGIFEPVYKDDRGFHIRKQEIILDVDTAARTIRPRVGAILELQYSLKDKAIKVLKNGKELTPNEYNIDLFFKGNMSTGTILNAISTTTNRDLFRFAYDMLGKEGQERTFKFSRALMRLFNYPNLELFTFCGFGKSLRSIWRNTEWRRSRETQPHKILGVPKYLLKYLKELGNFGKYAVEELRILDERLNGNNVCIIADIMKEESDIGTLPLIAREIIELYEEYGYKDVKRLILYVAREVKLQQGIDSPREAITLLRDYARMSKEMGFKFDKYPKSLKKEHDIAAMNYRARQDGMKTQMFKEVVSEEDYQKLAYRQKDFSIVIPETPKDLIDEGSALSHCVASYVNDVINKRCKIVFLRNTEELDKPLVTIEVRDNNIRQVRGFGNRAPHRDELDFVYKWAEKKELKVNLY